MTNDNNDATTPPEPAADQPAVDEVVVETAADAPSGVDAAETPVEAATESAAVEPADIGADNAPTPGDTATESIAEVPAAAADMAPAAAADSSAEPSTESSDGDEPTPVEPAPAEPAAEPESAPSADAPAAATAADGSAPATPPPGPQVIVARSVSSLPDDLSPEDFEAAIDETVLEFSEGDIIEGTVVNLDQDEVLVDIGYKSEGVIPANELSIRKNVPPSEVVSIGERIEALVLDKEDDEGRLILSKKRAQYERAWGRIQQITDAGGTVKGHVIEVVKGGLIVDIGLRGFLPASLVELRRVRDLDPYIGTEIEAKVIELDRNRNNVVLSRRAYLEEEQQEQRQAFLDDLAEGEVREGVVSSVVNFGAFVDLGGMDGLVHVSELSWRHVNHPSEVVKVGDKVTVRVLEVDRGRERISLSIKQTETDPWEAFSSAHELGDVVEGTVTKTVPFGAFVSVGAGVEGLVHVSEIAMHRVESPELELSLNQKVQVKITEMDEERRRVSLSIKQALPDWKDRETRQAPPRRRQPEVREFEKEEDKEEERSFDVDASLEAILQELKERGIGRR